MMRRSEEPTQWDWWLNGPWRGIRRGGRRYRCLFHKQLRAGPSEWHARGALPGTAPRGRRDPQRRGRAGSVRAGGRDTRFRGDVPPARVRCFGSPHRSRFGRSVLDVGRKTRTIPPAVRRALEARDRGCRFPGCGLRFTDAHHIRHWADGGETKLGNLVLLCSHHYWLLHEEGWTVEWWGKDRQPAFIDPRGSDARRPAAKGARDSERPGGGADHDTRRRGAEPDFLPPGQVEAGGGHPGRRLLPGAGGPRVSASLPPTGRRTLQRCTVSRPLGVCSAET